MFKSLNPSLSFWGRLEEIFSMFIYKQLLCMETRLIWSISTLLPTLEAIDNLRHSFLIQEVASQQFHARATAQLKIVANILMGYSILRAQPQAKFFRARIRWISVDASMTTSASSTSHMLREVFTTGTLWMTKSISEKTIIWTKTNSSIILAVSRKKQIYFTAN